MQQKQKIIATIVCVIQAIALLLVGKFVATWVGGIFPHYGGWIDKGVLIVTFVPLMYFIIGPYIRKLSADSRRSEAEK
jgi:membrane protein implicated in regulation of membrane protease activity